MKDNVFEIPKSKESGIYMIYNVELNKVYIGQTNNFYQRASSHLSQLLSGTHSNNELQNDFNNGYRFAFAILEVVEKDKLLLKEKQYIYAFRKKSIKTYNQESTEQIKNKLFYEIVCPEIDKLHRDFHNKFGCNIALLVKCKPETRINKCIEKGME